jgi:hypothetical protein
MMWVADVRRGKVVRFMPAIVTASPFNLLST